MGERNLNNLRYAEEITLLASNEENMRNLITKVQTTSEAAGLYLNMDKTKIMSIATLDTFIIGNNHAEVVDKFTLLGSVIKSDGDCKMEMMRRLALRRAAMVSLDKIWKDRELTVPTKTKLVRALVLPVAMYG